MAFSSQQQQQQQQRQQRQQQQQQGGSYSQGYSDGVSEGYSDGYSSEYSQRHDNNQRQYDPYDLSNQYSRKERRRERQLAEELGFDSYDEYLKDKDRKKREERKKLLRQKLEMKKNKAKQDYSDWLDGYLTFEFKPKVYLIKTKQDKSNFTISDFDDSLKRNLSEVGKVVDRKIITKLLSDEGFILENDDLNTKINLVYLADLLRVTLGESQEQFKEGVLSFFKDASNVFNNLIGSNYDRLYLYGFLKFLEKKEIPIFEYQTDFLMYLDIIPLDFPEELGFDLFSKIYDKRNRIVDLIGHLQLKQISLRGVDSYLLDTASLDLCVEKFIGFGALRDYLKNLKTNSKFRSNSNSGGSMYYGTSSYNYKFPKESFGALNTIIGFDLLPDSMSALYVEISRRGVIELNSYTSLISSAHFNEARKEILKKEGCSFLY